MALAGSRRKMGALDLVVLMLGLLSTIQHSTQQSLRNPLPDFLDRINLATTKPSIALVLSSSNNEKALNESNAFVASSTIPYVDIFGRRYRIGKIGTANVVYTVAGSGTVNTALAAQILVDTFHVEGIVYVGTSGSVNSSLSVGDVVVPKEVANTGSWTWHEYSNKSETLTKGGKLKFGDYNLPEAGENSLGTIEFDAIQVPTANKTKTLFWLQPDADWLEIAQGLQSTKLQCAGEERNSNCLSSSSKVVYGLRGVSSDIYVKNAAYGKYLNTKFKASIVDKGCASVAQAAMSSGQPFILFRGVSNIVGGSKSSSSASYLASVNAVTLATKFIQKVATLGRDAYY